MKRGPLNFIASRARRRSSVTPLGSEFIVMLGVLFAMLFILSASLAFVNPGASPLFRDSLNELSAQQSGIVLLGENVDVDVDEPTVTIRWSVLGCGTEYVLPGSPKLHGSMGCGAPSVPIDVFLDDSDTPIFTYDPESVPISQKTNQHIIVQTQVQFDSSLVLNGHDTRLYPFDTYMVSTSLRATTSNSSVKDIPVPVIGLPVIKHMPSFTMSARDTDILTIIEDEKQPAKHVEIEIRRPAHARIYAMVIFGINWAFCHLSIGTIFLLIIRGARTNWKETAKGVIVTHAVLFAIPQMRSAMPDAPGLDGVLIDTIGYFPQMTLAGLSVVVLLLVAAKRELDKLPQDTFLGCSTMRDSAYERLQFGGETEASNYSSGKDHSRQLSD